VTLDRGGTKTEVGFADHCSEFKVLKATKDGGGGHRYVFTGSCGGFEGLPNIQFEAVARFDWLGQFSKASESVKVMGGVTGQVHGHDACTGSGNFTFSKMPGDARIIPKVQLPHDLAVAHTGGRSAGPRADRAAVRRRLRRRCAQARALRSGPPRSAQVSSG
jgi:hypothetical protein